METGRNSELKEENNCKETDTMMNEKDKDAVELEPPPGEPASQSPTKDKSDEADDTSGLPIDRGWAWVILAAAILNVFIFRGITKPYGVFFVEYQKRFDANASATSVISTVSSVISSVATLFVLAVVLQKVSVRAVVMTGAVLTSASYLIAAFATDIGVLYFSFGVLGGLGFSMVFLPVLTPVNQYFKKHRAMANSVMMSGSSAGSVVFAPVLTALFDRYGYTGAMLIVSALMLNIAVAGALLRPIEFYSKLKKKRAMTTPQTDQVKEHTKLKPDLSGTGTGVTRSLTHLDNTDKALVSQNRGLDVEELKPFLPDHKSRSLEILSTRNTSETNQNVASGGISDVMKSISRSFTSMQAIPETVAGALTEVPSQETRDADGSGVERSRLKSLFDKDSLLRNPVFLLNIGMTFVILPSSFLVLVYAAPFAKDHGISERQIGLFYTVTGALDWFARIAVGLIVDRKWLRHTTLIALASIVIGTTSHLMRFFMTFPALMLFAVLMGLCCGVYSSLFGAVLADFIGMEKFKPALGGSGLIQGISLGVFFPITGGLRDISGSYTVPFHCIGVLAYIGAALSFALPVVHNRRQSNVKKEETS